MLEVNDSRCIACGGCVGVCPVDALELDQGRDILVDNNKCIDCQICVRFCPVGALKVFDKEMKEKPLTLIKLPSKGF